MKSLSERDLIAGLHLISSIHILSVLALLPNSLDKFEPDQVTCSVDDKKVDCDTWGETDYAECVDHLVDSMEETK